MSVFDGDTSFEALFYADFTDKASFQKAAEIYLARFSEVRDVRYSYGKGGRCTVKFRAPAGEWDALVRAPLDPGLAAGS